MFKSFSQNRAIFPLVYLGTYCCHFLAGWRRRLAIAHCRRVPGCPDQRRPLLVAELSGLCLLSDFRRAVAGWFIRSPHRWQYWSILGTALIYLLSYLVYG